MNAIQQHPLGNERRKSFISALEQGAQHFQELSHHTGGLKSPRTNLDMSKLAKALDRRVGHQLQNMAKDTERGHFAGITELASGLAHTFNQILRAAKDDPDQHEYENQVLSRVMKFFSTPGLKQAAYDLQDGLVDITKIREVNQTTALHQAA